MFRKLLEILIIYLFCQAIVVSAEFTFEHTMRSVTTQPDVDVVNIEFAFENKSNQEITIVNYDAPCSCMEARMVREDKKNSLVFPPGAKGKVVGMLEFGTFKGTIDKVIKIRTDKDTSDEPSIILTCRVTIPVLIGTDKETLSWEVGEELESKEFRIIVSDESKIPIKIIDHKHGFGAGAVFDYQLETITEGKEYKVTVTPLKTTERAMGVLKFYTDSQIPRYKLVQIFLLVDKPKKSAE